MKLVANPRKRDFYIGPEQWTARLQQIAKEYPDRVALAEDLNARFAIQPTAQGHHLSALRIAAKGEPRLRVLIDAGYHSDELLAMKALDLLLDNILREGSFADVQFVIVPTVNIDGLHAVFSKDAKNRNNCRATPNPASEQEVQERATGRESFAVDLNRNYPSLAFGQGQMRAGPFPLSEVETQVMDRLASSEPFDLYLSFHDAGDKLVVPKPKSEAQSAKVTAWMGELRGKLAGTKYAVEMATDDGISSEYFMFDKGIPGATIEIGLDRGKHAEDHAPEISKARGDLESFLLAIAALLK